MKTVTSQEQTCTDPGRNIFSNLFTLREIIHYTNEKNINGFIMSIDQENAFDKIDREFLFESLLRLGYPNEFVNFLKIIYKNTMSATQNNGFMYSYLKSTR